MTARTETNGVSPVAAQQAGESSVAHDVFEIGRFVDESWLADKLQQIFNSDQRSTFAAFEETAAYCRDVMESIGLVDVELEPLPADGSTQYGDWMMPLAWDVREADLTLMTGTGDCERLADYAILPDSLIMQSAPTDAGGWEGDLVLYDPQDPDRCRGKAVFTSEHAQQIKAEVARAGGVGIVSYHHPNPEEDPDSTYWYNTWSDRPGGWLASRDDSRIWGFSLSPNQGRALENRLKQGEALRVRAHVDSRFYNGSYPFVSGKIPAEEGSPFGDEELIVCAHMYEHGAHDNASGAATVLGIAQALQSAIRTGALQAPQRGLRFLLMPECYGTVAYAALRSERIRRTKAGVNLDGVGGGRPVNVIGEPACTRAGLQPLMLEALGHAFPPDELKAGSFELADNLLSDPAIGVPMVWPHAPCSRQTWHTSMDTVEVTSPDSMARMVKGVGAFLMDLSRREIRLEAKDARGCECVSVNGDPRAKRVPVRQGIGPITLDPIPMSEWPSEINGSPRWFTVHTQALWWADGQRTIGDILQRLGKDESQTTKICDYFDFLEKHNYIKFG